MYNLRDIAKNFKTDENFTGSILLDELMAPRTTFKIGGAAPVFLEPTEQDSFVHTVSYLTQEHVPLFILGGGSNIVVSDDGFDGVVISTGGLSHISVQSKQTIDNFEKIGQSRTEVILACDAGVSMQSIVNFCINNAYTGFEYFSGLPGSVGGAVYMNARCYGVQISDFIQSIRYIENNQVKDYFFNQGDWGYKKSPFSGTKKIILQCTIKVIVTKIDSVSNLKEKASSFLKNRIEKGHFKYPSAGSVFKNNKAFGIPSGQIIDEAGLCGISIGGAQIAPWHGNIIINKNKATSKDVLQLVNYTIDEVKRKKNLELVPEIIFCGKI